jgi:hypothetical protein
MQISATSTSYLLQSLRSAAGVEAPEPPSARQYSPGGEGPPPLRNEAGSGGRFAGATLASLLSVQETSADDLASQLIGELDTDSDGAIGQDEAAAAVGEGADIAAGFAKLDTSGDGVLGADELAAAIDDRPDVRGPPPGPPPHRHAGGAEADASAILAKLDGNGDGGLSADEVSTALETTAAASTETASGAAAPDGFSDLDTDGDGRLSLAELSQSLLQAFADGRRYGQDLSTAAADAASTASTTA